jgi:signal peptidase II
MLRWLWLSAAVVLVDQATKQFAEQLLDAYRPVPVLPFFNLTLMYNTGAAFSLLSDAGGWQRWLFVALALGVTVAFAVWLGRLQRSQRWTAAALSLVIGGAVGNLIDRILEGRVVDFIQLYYEQWYWPAFNVADSAISVGVAILLVESLFARRSTSTA